MKIPELIYEVFPRVHGPTGTFRDIASRLDELDELGIDTVWLMPMYPVGRKGRKGPYGSPYAIRNFMGIDQRLGTATELRALVRAVHAHDMRILLDFVPNHCSQDNPLIKKHPSWIRRDSDGKPLPPEPHWTDVYSLNYENRNLRRYMRSVMRYWLDKFDIDGYRVDAAHYVPNHFWEETLPLLKKEYPDVLFLAEAQGAFWQKLGFDLSYDGDLRTAIWEAANGKKTAAAIRGYFRHLSRSGQDDRFFLRFTENHDIARTQAVFSAKTWRAALGLVMTLPGVPLIYAGQEYGLRRTVNIFGSEPIDWENGSKRVHSFYKKLTGIRRRHPSLAEGKPRFLKNSQPDSIVTYLRESEKGPILVASNICGKACDELTIELPPRLKGYQHWKNLLAGKTLPCGNQQGRLTFTLPSNGLLIASACDGE